MKKAVTFRLDSSLLEKARRSADADNRTLTNYVETALKRAIDGQNLDPTQQNTSKVSGNSPA